MRAEERERLVRVGLRLVLGERASALLVVRTPDDGVVVGEEGHVFGFPADDELGDDPRTVMEHDLERLVDELCETSVAWGERLPVCPLHPGVHALDLVVTDATATASCPVTGAVIRSAAY